MGHEHQDTQARAVAALVIALLATAACDRAPERAAPGSPHASATTAATPAPAEALTLTIGGRPADFPPARLRLLNKGGTLVAQLFTDDPPEAINDDYRGNSLFLEMPLTIDDPALLGETVWRYEAASDERQESVNGIFLDGGRLELQPAEVTVSFERGGDEFVLVRLEGTFTVFSGPVRSKAEGRAPVSGSWWAPVR